MTRSSRAAAPLALALLLAPACKRQEVRPAATIEEAPRLASSIQMNNPGEAKQLIAGFYGLEANAWRWTARQFAVNLRPPSGSLQRGASLDLRLTVPGPSLEALGNVTLSATVGGLTLPPQTYSKSGSYSYLRFVPANMLTGDSVRVDFQLDKAIPPGDVDKRELGIVVSSVSLVAK